MTPKKTSRGTSQEAFAKYYRQRVIQLLERITKNLFRMFRDDTTTKAQLEKRFFELKAKIDGLGEVYLDTEYHKKTREYIELLAQRLKGSYDLDELRDKQMTQLNRLQKLKNVTNYKRTKKIRVHQL